MLKEMGALYSNKALVNAQAVYQMKWMIWCLQ